MSRLLLLLLWCAHVQAQNVGDIAFDPALDDTSFHLHDSTRVFQYYNSVAYWLDHKDSITRFIRSRYHPPAGAANANGWLTIRFIINAEGRTGRFRVQEMDTTYQPTHFDPQISQTLLAAIKDWPDWQPAHYREKRYDTYQYVTFRLQRGRITTISP
jgi:hypothetical protein